jgi:hypothetical protein
LALNSIRIPDDVAPERSLFRFEIVTYKDVSPTGFATDFLSCGSCLSWLKIRPGLRWPLAFCPGPCGRPVFADGQTLQSAIMQKTFNAKTQRRDPKQFHNEARKP